MFEVRAFRREELPAILARSVATAAGQLVLRDLPGATAEGLAGQIRQMFETALLMPDATVLVVDWPAGVSGQGPAAYALVMPQPNGFTGERELVVLDIYIDPLLRGRKLGRPLVDRVLAYGRQVGARSVVAQIAVHNAASRGLFRSSGFAEERVVVGRRV